MPPQARNHDVAHQSLYRGHDGFVVYCGFLSDAASMVSVDHHGVVGVSCDLDRWAAMMIRSAPGLVYLLAVPTCFWFLDCIDQPHLMLAQATEL